MSCGLQTRHAGLTPEEAAKACFELDETSLAAVGYTIASGAGYETLPPKMDIGHQVLAPWIAFWTACGYDDYQAADALDAPTAVMERVRHCAENHTDAAAVRTGRQLRRQLLGVEDV